MDASALPGDEGRGYQRYATVRWKQPLTRGFPNGETHPVWGIRSEYIRGRKRTRRIEPSQYPGEEKSTEIPKVAASEMGRA